MISLKKLGAGGYIDDRLYSVLRKNFERLYLQKKFKGFFNKVMEVRDALKVSTEFQVVKPRGKVTVTYSCRSDCVGVQADFSELIHDGCREILMLNEQGSSYLPRYIDSNGVTLTDNQIGAWDNVTAGFASLQSISGTLSFGVSSQPWRVTVSGF